METKLESWIDPVALKRMREQYANSRKKESSFPQQQVLPPKKEHYSSQFQRTSTLTAKQLRQIDFVLDQFS